MIRDIESELRDIWDRIEGSASWLYYNETFYIRKYDKADKELIYRVIDEDFIGGLFREEIINRYGDKEGREVLKESKITSIIDKFIRHIRERYRRDDDFIKQHMNLNLMAFKNGYIDISELKVGNVKLEYLNPNADKEERERQPVFFEQIPHNFNIERYNDVKALSVDEILEKHALNIKKFLTDIVGFQYVNLQIAKIGYCFYRHNPFKILFMEIGEKDSGKTTFLNLVRYILGDDNVSGEALQDLANYSFARIELYHKLANINSELPKTALRETSLVKSLCGEDVISANRKHQTAFKFLNYAKGFFATNELPQVRDIKDTAFYSRWLLTKYPNSFERNDAYAESLYNEEEIEAVIVASVMLLGSTIKGGFNVYLGKDVREVDSGIGVQEEWVRATNPIYNFIETYKERKRLIINVADKSLRTPKHDLLSACNTFISDETDAEQIKLRTLTEELERLYHIKTERPRNEEGKQSRENEFYSGLQLSNEPLNAETLETPQNTLFSGEGIVEGEDNE